MKENTYLQALKNIFSVDLRGLAVFRILFGSIMLYDIIDRITFAKAHYTDDGIIPRDIVIKEDWLDWLFSIHLMNGDTYWQVILFCIYGFFALSVLVGYRTKTSLFICWLFMHSTHARNSLITTGADNVMRMTAFWALFLPIAALWSVDRYLDKNKENTDKIDASKPYATASSVALIVQMLSIYFFSVFCKTGNTWKNGEAVYYTLQLEHYTTWLGTIVGQNYFITEMLTYFTMALEGWGFLLFLIPFKWQWFRFIGVSLYIGLHTGFIFTMNLGIFPHVCIIAWIACLPPMVWDFLFGLNTFKKLKFSISHRFSGGLEWLKEKHLLSNKFVHTYDGGMPAMVIVSVFMVLVFWWNWMRVDKVEMPQVLKQVVRVTRVNQKWGMFAPNPSRSDGWYVIHGRFSDGSQMDLLTETPLTGCVKTVDIKKDNDCTDIAKPESISAIYDNHRWRKYFNNFHRKKKSKFRKYYGKYLAKKWQDKLEGTGKKLETFEIFFIEEKTGPNYTVEYMKKHSLWKHWTDKEHKQYFYPNGEDEDKKDLKTKKSSSKSSKKTTSKASTNKKKVPRKDERGVIIFDEKEEDKIGNSDDSVPSGGNEDKPKVNPKDIEPTLDGE